jgi:hypothetical protein
METTTNLDNGVITVGTSVVKLTTEKVSTNLVIIADVNNTGIVYVGTSTVTTLNGFPLDKGQSLEFSGSSADNAYLIGSAAGQSIRYLRDW